MKMPEVSIKITKSGVVSADSNHIGDIQLDAEDSESGLRWFIKVTLIRPVPMAFKLGFSDSDIEKFVGCSRTEVWDEVFPQLEYALKITIHSFYAAFWQQSVRCITSDIEVGLDEFRAIKERTKLTAVYRQYASEVLGVFSGGEQATENSGKFFYIKSSRNYTN